MQSKQIFFFDFDDTLYSHTTKSVPKSTQYALNKLRAHGHTLVISTGRGPDSMSFIQQQVAVPCDMMVFLNGQLIFRKGQKVFERFITLPSIHFILEKMRAHGFAYGGYSAHGEMVDHVNERVSVVWNDFLCTPPPVMERFESSYPLYQAHLYITKEEAEHVKEHLDDYWTNWSHEYMVNLISKEAGKSQAVRWFLGELDIPKEHSFAFGDGFNDQDMLVSVGHGIAMGNALDELKQVAEHVTGRADEDGIRQALEFYGII
ncbi:HAD family hydrolase [Paenibacillus filicis]|uniref:HAD family hydrolase n=1 Tax=Paenibacillus filicis TaxID=669464 RepID=A0ABU9DH30_9BACL